MKSDGQGLTVRDATPTDVQAIVALNCEVQAIHARLAPRRFRSNVDFRALESYFTEKIGSADNRFVLVVADERAVAYAWFAIENVEASPLTFERRRLRWHHAVVAEAWRRRSIGSTLHGIAVNYAHKMQCDEIAVDAWTNNAGAVNFYRRMGFNAERIYFSMADPPPSKPGGPADGY